MLACVLASPVVSTAPADAGRRPDAPASSLTGDGRMEEPHTMCAVEIGPYAAASSERAAKGRHAPPGPSEPDCVPINGRS